MPCETFGSAEAERMPDRLEFHYTPRHGNWLNMVQTEVSILSEQCLKDLVPREHTMRREVVAWEDARTNWQATVERHFSTPDTRNRLKRLGPITSELPWRGASLA